LRTCKGGLNVPEMRDRQVHRGNTARVERVFKGKMKRRKLQHAVKIMRRKWEGNKEKGGFCGLGNRKTEGGEETWKEKGEKNISRKKHRVAQQEKRGTSWEKKNRGRNNLHTKEEPGAEKKWKEGTKRRRRGRGFLMERYSAKKIQVSLKKNGNLFEFYPTPLKEVPSDKKERGGRRCTKKMFPETRPAELERTSKV